jgi:hypothetical protein
LWQDLLTLFFRIKIAGKADQRSEHEGFAGVGCVDTIIVYSQSASYTRQADVEKGVVSVEENEEALQLPKHDDERHKEESLVKLKEWRRLAELGCLRLQKQYQMYRLRWLEEHYRARILKKYAPAGISTYSHHRIEWDSPSPSQSMSDTPSPRMN